MLNDRSRYKETKGFVENERTAGKALFKGLRSREIGLATGVIEYEVKQGDRLDHLARNYYNNDRLWWRILDANPHIIYGADMMLDSRMVGEVILIPREVE